MTDTVDHPDHYGGDEPYEVIKVLRAWDLELAKGFAWGNLIKYTARAGKKDKDAVSDRMKAEWYASELVSIEAELAGRKIAAEDSVVRVVVGEPWTRPARLPDVFSSYIVLVNTPDWVGGYLTTEYFDGWTVGDVAHAAAEEWKQGVNPPGEKYTLSVKRLTDEPFREITLKPSADASIIRDWQQDPSFTFHLKIVTE